MTTAYSPGDTVSYRRSPLNNWRDARVVSIDLTEITPFIIEDVETGQRVSARESDLL